MIIGTTRLEAFSDGVIAIIITIMVLQLKIPDLSKEATSRQTLHYLHQILPYFISYAFSFMMVGIFWTHHHHLFHLLEKTDQNLVWQNFIFLFTISLIPIATSILGTNPLLHISVAIYGLIMLLSTLSFLVMQQYSLHKKLLHKDTNRELTIKVLQVSVKARSKAIIGSVIYLISIPLAYVNVYFSYFCFLIPPIIFFVPEGIDNEKLAEKVAKKNK